MTWVVLLFFCDDGRNSWNDGSWAKASSLSLSLEDEGSQLELEEEPGLLDAGRVWRSFFRRYS